MILLLLALVRIYHVVAIADLRTTRSTHVEVTGKVTLVKREDDGDVHIRISDTQRRFVVAEIIPLLPLTPPKVRECVRVRGIQRIDNWPSHSWAEINPVEVLDVIPCR